MKLAELITDNNNKLSMMRIMSLLCCFTAISIAFIGINRTMVDYSGLSLLCSTFLTAAMGGKIMQKRIETTGAKSEVKVEK